MSNINKYFDGLKELHDLDLESDEADNVRDKLDPIFYSLNDAEKKIGQIWSVSLYNIKDIKTLQSEVELLTRAVIVLTGLVLVTIVVGGIKLFG